MLGATDEKAIRKTVDTLLALREMLHDRDVKIRLLAGADIVQAIDDVLHVEAGRARLEEIYLLGAMHGKPKTRASAIFWDLMSSLRMRMSNVNMAEELSVAHLHETRLTAAPAGVALRRDLARCGQDRISIGDLRQAIETLQWAAGSMRVAGVSSLEILKGEDANEPARQ